MGDCMAAGGKERGPSYHSAASRRVSEVSGQRVKRVIIIPGDREEREAKKPRTAVNVPSRQTVTMSTQTVTEPTHTDRQSHRDRVFVCSHVRVFAYMQLQPVLAFPRIPFAFLLASRDIPLTSPARPRGFSAR